MLGADRPPLGGVHPRRYADRDGMGRSNATRHPGVYHPESLQSTISGLAPFRTQETKKQGGDCVPAEECEMSPGSQPAIHPSIHPRSIDCEEKNETKSGIEEREDRGAHISSPDHIKQHVCIRSLCIRSLLFGALALGRVGSLLGDLLRVGYVLCMCSGARRRQGGFGFDTDCVNVNVDVRRSMSMSNRFISRRGGQVAPCQIWVFGLDFWTCHGLDR